MPRFHHRVFLFGAVLSALALSACQNSGGQAAPIGMGVAPTPTPAAVVTTLPVSTPTPLAATPTPLAATPTPVAGSPTPLPPAAVYYVADGASQAVDAFAVGANGNVAPTRSITGSNTGLGYSRRVALDAHGTLYVANAPPTPQPHSITEYNVASTGNVSPIRTISGPVTGLTGADGLLTDSAGDLFVANCGGCFDSMGTDAVLVFAPGASGNTTPMRDISGSNTLLGGTTNVSLDPTQQTLYVTCSCGTNAAVYTFPATGTGNIAPTTILSGPNTQLGFQIECAVATATTLYVCDTMNNAIRMYATPASGNVAPIGTLAGSMTQLMSPTQVELDTAGNLYVANPGNGSITVYPPGATGNMGPTKVVIGAATGLNQPIGLQLSP